MHGFHFGLSQPQTHSWMHRLLPVLRRAFVALDMAPERDASRVATRPLLLAGAPAGALDGPERRRQRPPDAAQQTAPYSGKKQAHTKKHVLLLNAYTSKVGYLSPPVAGKTHDKQAVDEADRVSPVNSTLDKATGFQGYEPAGVLTQQPQKASRPGGERWGQVPQSSDLQCPNYRGTRDCRREAVPHRQRCLASNTKRGLLTWSWRLPVACLIFA